MGSTENFCLRWNDFESNVSGAFRDLRAEADFFDVTLGCTNSNGRSLQAHKVILSACSSFFKSMLRQQSTQNSHPNPYIYLRGVSFSDLSSVLDFMYHGEVNVAQEDLNSFLAVAEELQIKGLTNKDGRPSSGEPSKDRKSHSGPGRPGGVGPPQKRQRRSSPPPNSANIGSQSAKSENSSGDIRPADIKSDPESLGAGPSSSGHLQSGGPAVTDFEDGDNQGDFDESYQDDYYNDNEGEGGEGMLGDDVASGGGGDVGEEGTGKEFFDDQYRSGGKLSGIPSSITVKRYHGTGAKRGRVSLRLASQQGLMNPNHQQATNSSSDAGLSPLPQGRAKCLLCAKEFSNMYNARTHIKELHSDKQAERPLHFCHVCGATFTVARSRLNHLMRKHGISQRMMKNANYVLPAIASADETDNENISIKDEPDIN